MNKNRIEGAGKHAAGSIKEAIFKITGDKRTEVEGAAEKVAGKLQSGVGQTTDGVRDVLKR